VIVRAEDDGQVEIAGKVENASPLATTLRQSARRAIDQLDGACARAPRLARRRDLREIVGNGLNDDRLVVLHEAREHQ
jgi:hypothetical protein